METAILTEKYSKAAQQTNLPNYCANSNVNRMNWLNETTQIEETIFFSISISNANHALNRLEFIKNSEWYQKEGITNSVFQNSKKAINHLDSYIRFLDPEEIGPTGNGTILMNFEKSDIILALEIGETTVAHVYSDGREVYFREFQIQ